MRTSRWADRFGWFLEKGFIWIIGTLYTLIFLGNKILLHFDIKYGSLSIEKLLYCKYDLLIEPNIGVITTVAAIFVGIFITVLSVLGGIKANSIIALLSNNDLKKIVKYIITGLSASFAVVFYSFFAVAITNHFIKSFLFFYLIIYMLLTALRLGINLSLIYSHDLNKLSENLEQERRDAENHKYVMNMLEKYLNDKEEDRIRRGE